MFARTAVIATASTAHVGSFDVVGTPTRQVNPNELVLHPKPDAKPVRWLAQVNVAGLKPATKYYVIVRMPQEVGRFHDFLSTSFTTPPLPLSAR